MSSSENRSSLDIEARFGELKRLVEAGLERYLPRSNQVPPILLESMRYSLFAGGKRIRPILALLACRVCGGRDADALPVACALEMIHTYSLIHDDLPAMDDDAMRRGVPTNHVRFGEAIAILAGDALLTQAFEVIAAETPSKDRVAAIIRILGAAVGPGGMVGGQVLDLASRSMKQDADTLTGIHALKTAALLGAAARLGGVAAGAPEPTTERLERYGRRLGLAFQAIDDVLDEEGTQATLGKTAGKDRRSEKLTSASLYGVDGARQRAAEFSGEARALAAGIPGGEVLEELADFLVNRKC